MQNDHSEAVAGDPEYLRLHQEHRDHEERLLALAHKARLSEDEELEEKRLKKEKLALKDRMEAIARSYREGVTH
ncbi:MAG: YdcH family protein [Thermoanaerobaculia bacterium]|nr:YdcH family protein [Thermoanaerobaculia bacterium]